VVVTKVVMHMVCGD